MIDVGLVGLFWWLLAIGVTVVAIRRLRVRQRTDLARRHRLACAPTGSSSSGSSTASLFNSITTEGLGAGVNVSAIWWFVAMAWAVVLDRTARSTPPPTETAPIEAAEPAEAQPIVSS